MIGSTNYLERLDPGLSKRPSRFDRKFEFPKPDEGERVMYCEYWRHKLQKKKSDEQDGDDSKVTNSINPIEDEDFDDLVHIPANASDDLEFPKELSNEIAKITDGFSFAYLQEAFVATLLNIASLHDGDEESDDIGKKEKDKFDDLLFWRVIKKQIALLKEQI